MTRFGAMVRALTIVAVATGMSSAALAQQKTAKQCRDEWRANEADFKAKNVKEKDYVTQCRAGTAAAPVAPTTSTTTTAPATPAAATSGQKTAKQCRDEWRANEADFKTKNIKEKDYVTQCRAGTAAAPTTPTTTAAPATPPATPPAATSGQKTAKQCRDEWRANEADFKAKKVTERDYVAQCRAGTAPTPTAAPATPPAPTTTTTTAPPPAPPAQPAPAPTQKTTAAPKPAPTATAAPTGANQFAAEAQAKAHCRSSDIVVWVNTDSKVYHFSGHKDYGKTKEGAYMCETDALAAGDRASKSEKHP